MLLLFCMGIGPLCQWQQMSGKSLLKQLQYNFIISLIFGGLLPWLVIKNLSVLTSFALMLACWVIASMLFVKKITRNRLGMILAHVGVGVCVIGIALNSTLSLERDVKMTPGDSATLGAYHFQLLGVHPIQGANYTGAVGDFLITTKDGMPVTTLHAENRIYTVQQVAMTEAAIDMGLFRDLYVALAEPLPNNAWAVRLYDKPFVRWIWAGDILMLLGGLLAASDKRYLK